MTYCLTFAANQWEISRFCMSLETFRLRVYCTCTGTSTGTPRAARSDTLMSASRRICKRARSGSLDSSRLH